jgi:hypothetical protein
MDRTMKLAALALAFGLAAPAAVQAAPAAEPAAAPAAAKPLNTQDTTIGELLENPAAKAIIDKHIPGLSENAQIGMAGGMTLRAIQPMAGDKIPVEALDAIDADLAKLPVK